MLNLPICFCNEGFVSGRIDKETRKRQCPQQRIIFTKKIIRILSVKES